MCCRDSQPTCQRATEEEDGENDALHKISSRLRYPPAPSPVSECRIYRSLQVSAFSPSPQLLLPGSKCGTINMQKPFSKEEQCWSNPQIQSLDGAQKAVCGSAAQHETAQGMGSGPRSRQCHRVSLGPGGSCILAMVVCMVRGFVLLFAPVLEKSEQNPSKLKPPVGNAVRHYLQHR